MIEGEGFPTHRDPFNKGRLIVVFSVEFPESLSEANAKKIQAALPKVQRPTIPNPSEEVKLKEFDGEGKPSTPSLSDKRVIFRAKRL